MNREDGAIDGKSGLRRRKRAVLAERYGFTDWDLDFIFNYDIKYRMERKA